MNKVFAAMELVCIFMLLVVLYGHLFENRRRDELSKSFTWVVLATLLAVSADMVSWYYENSPGHDSLLYVTNFLAATTPSLIMMAFALYEYNLINRSKPISIWFVRGMTMAQMTAVLLFLALTLLGETFSVNDGVFGYESLYMIPTFVSAASAICYIVVAVKNRKVLGRHGLTALLVYILLPMAFTGIEVIVGEYTIDLVFISISVLVLYIMLQSSRLEDLRERSRSFSRISFTDELTGIQNRRAFDQELDSLPANESLGVVFCDVNNLKNTNDLLGHDAGDDMLIRFVNTLKRYYPEKNLYRIGGDEFVVLVSGREEPGFSETGRSLIEELISDEDLASVGFSYGTAVRSRALLHEAEKQMYENKKQAYLRHPEYARRSFGD